MRYIRGRVKQYKILAQRQEIKPYLMPNERFSKASLFSMLAHYNQIILKPNVGQDFITVLKEQQIFKVVANQLSHEVNLENLYETLHEQMNNSNFVIQPQLQAKSYFKKMYQRSITVQKRGVDWKVTNATKQSNDLLESFAFLKSRAKIQHLAQIAAMELWKFYPNCEAVVVEFLFNLNGDVWITDSVLHFSVSKWNQYQALALFMPKTDLLTEATFHNYVTIYPIVFIKPCNGQQGKGIIKISKVSLTAYEVQIGRQKWIKQSIPEVYELSRSLLQVEKYYIIQQGIPLATIENCFTDLRVMTQKAGNVWHVTGKVVRRAGPHFFVTNAAQDIFTLTDALRRSTIYRIFHRPLDYRIDRLCLKAAKLLDEQQERSIIGFDVGVTNWGRIRIIEGNYVPDLSFFRDIEDSSMYNTILNYRTLRNSPNERG